MVREIKDWVKLSDGKFGFYLYNYNLADAALPFTKFTAYKQQQKLVHELDLKQLAWTLETMDTWASHAPHVWLSARLSWNINLDIDKELDRFFNGFYGAAAKPMARYWRRIDDAYASSNVHTGSVYGQHHIWTDELLTASRKDIELAKAGLESA